MRTLILLVIPCLLAHALTTSLATADGASGLVISSGREGGSYHDIARGLRAVLRSTEGMMLEVRSSAGSLENLALLDDPASTVGLVLTQVDALKYYIDENAEFGEEYIEIADVGKECVFLIVGKQSAIKSAADLKSEDMGSLAVGRMGGGAAVTWEYMNRLEPAFRRTRPVELGIIEALLQLVQTNRPSLVVAAMLVQRPIVAATPIEIVLDQSDRFAIVPIRAGDIGPAALTDGRAVYSFEKISVGFGRDHRQSFDTLCTRGLLVAARAKLTEEQLAAVTRAMNSSRAFIAPGSD